MINTPYKFRGWLGIGLGLFCALFVFGHSPAMAGWKEANAALEAGKLSEALAQIRPLAEQGDTSAQYMLGYLLSGATGVEHDLTEAFKWYTIAYAQGQANAATARAMVGRKLGPFKAAEAQRQAKEWLQEHGMDSVISESKARPGAAGTRAGKAGVRPKKK